MSVRSIVRCVIDESPMDHGHMTLGDRMGSMDELKGDLEEL